MAPPPVRKSGRIKSGKVSSLRSEDFEYDETKFEGEEISAEGATQFVVDVSSNICDLLQSHSKEKSAESLPGGLTSFPLVMSKLQKGGSQVSSGGDHEDERGPYIRMPSLVCPLCNVELSTEEDVESHLAEHEAENAGKGELHPVPCEACGKLLPDLTSYRKHLKCHMADRPFQCGQCEKTFQDSCSLKRHMKIHEDDRPFSCEICLKSFRDAASISRHMLTHTDRPRLFQCSICDKNFTDKSGLKRHERTHTGVRPYVCNVCNKSFLDSCSFRRHEKIHIGIKNHHCPQCKKSFMEKQSLVRHQKTACRFRDHTNGDAGVSVEDDIPYGNDSHISSLSGDYLDESSLGLVSDKDHQDSSNSSFPAPSTPISLSLVQMSGLGRELNIGGSPMKTSVSLSSLIRKDPQLYEGITEIVDSIDSYEKMLDLCGDEGQEEIDAVLKRDSAPMPDNLLCFECGELLVDGANFRSEGKTFHASMTNAFKCLSCEEEDEEDDYGEPPVLMPHYNVSETDGKKDDMSIHPADCQPPEFMNRMVGNAEDNELQQSVLDDLGHQHHGLLQQNGSHAALSRSVSTDSDHSTSKPPVIDDLIVQNQDGYNQGDFADNETAFGPVDSMYSLQMTQPAATPSDHPKLEYEADDPNIPSVFPCHLCTKVFASSSFLARHLDLHKKSPFKCMVCGKTFTSAPALKRHMRLHTGEKPYACPVCNKQFRDPSNFSKHKKNCFHPTSLPTTDSPKAIPPAASHEEHNTPDHSMTASNGQKLGNDLTPDVSFVSHSEVESMDVSCIGKSMQEESLPVMAVMPSLDDDLMDESAEDKPHQDGAESSENGDAPKSVNYIPCEICQKLCESEQHLEMHMNYHNGNPDVTCIECGKSFADTFGMKRHMRLHTGFRPYSCEYCGRGYCDSWSLKKHRAKGCLQTEVQGETESMYPCSQCKRIFCDKSHLLEHSKMHKGVMKYECDVCMKGFSEAFNLKKHRRLHMAICPGCGQEFENMKLLTHHQENECTAALPAKGEADEGKAFSCDMCGRFYSTRAYLERHKKIHSEVKSHVCEICHKRFSEAFKLRRHKKASHSDLKPFVCQDCGKCFSDDAALKRHLVSSSCALSKVLGEPVGTESCVCQVCHKVFQKNYMLVRHMTVHSQDRPYCCDVCGRSYKDTSSLKRHQMVHQGVKEFVCPICGKDFYYSDSLKRHMSGRCGKKTKSRRRKGAAKKKKRSNTNYVPIKKNVVNDNLDVTLISHSDSIGKPQESWKNSLHTKPYAPVVLSQDPVPVGIRLGKLSGQSGKWSCVARKHCWLCDVKTPSVSGLMTHRRVHWLKRRFACRKCFLRFHRKIYWKCHQQNCHSVKVLNSNSSQIKLKRKRTSVNDMDTSCILPDEVVNEEGERKRPRRSVPRAQWTWISQI